MRNLASLVETEAWCENHHNRTLCCCEGLQSSCEFDTRTTAIVLQRQKLPLPFHNKVTEKLQQMFRRAIFEAAQPRGVTNASRGLPEEEEWKTDPLCVDLKVHTNSKAMDEDYSIPDMETNFQNLHVASYFGNIYLPCAY